MVRIKINLLCAHQLTFESNGYTLNLYLYISRRGKFIFVTVTNNLSFHITMAVQQNYEMSSNQCNGRPELEFKLSYHHGCPKQLRNVVLILKRSGTYSRSRRDIDRSDSIILL